MPIYRDRTIWSEEERALREAVQTLFKANYTREEIRFLVDKSLYSLCLCTWQLHDYETMEMLNMCKPNYIKHRDTFGFIRETSLKKTVEDERASAYYRNKIAPNRERVRKLIEDRKSAELAKKELENEPADDSLCADQRV